MNNPPIMIARNKIEPGTFITISLPSADIYTQTEINIPVHVFHGKKIGPKIFITATIHGDEINSIEILRRLKSQRILKTIQGTLIIIPIINVHGFIVQSRYLPDRRDLNRSFPGSGSGSFAARLANVLMEEIISKCDYGIDLHTGASGRINMPQLRVNLKTRGTKELAFAFDVPVILDAKIRDGSLRAAASELKIPILVYEGGEAMRFNELSVRAGVRGILNVLNYLGMIILQKKKHRSKFKPVITPTTHWVRAPISGVMQPLREIAVSVKKNEKIAMIHDPFLIGSTHHVTAPFDGIIIGRATMPLVNEGDAMFNIASIKRLRSVNAHIEAIVEEIISD